MLIEPATNLAERASVLVRVEYVDSHHELVPLHGAHIVGRRPTTIWRAAVHAVDFAGHQWTFSQSIANVDSQEWGGTPGAL